MLVVERGAPSSLAELWASTLSPQPRLGVLCPDVRYTLLMHEPTRRIATLLLERCPLVDGRAWRWRFNGSACIGWAHAALGFIFARELVLEDSRALFFGTPSASNAYVRSLLGPRVFFLGLTSVGTEHVRVASSMLGRFALVAPVSSLAVPESRATAAGEARPAGRAPIEALMKSLLGWSRVPPQPLRQPTRMSAEMGRMHDALAPYRAPLLAVAGRELREHNRADLEL